jgi:hypothetical protein
LAVIIRILGRTMSLGSRRTALVVAVAAALLLVFLVATWDRRTFIDGYPIGAVACADPESKAALNVNGHPWCGTFTAFALRSLDEAVPGHAVVVGLDLYRPDYPGVWVTRSGGLDLVAVLRFADNTVRSFYIGCGVGLDNERCFADPEYAKRAT